VPWQDRLREAAYTGPASGTRQTFLYEDVSREYEARGTVWEFPGVNEAYVQRTGFGSREYPLRCFFSGPNHDLEATAFEALLWEEGVGRLEHPMYGTVNVVPYGRITRRDDLKSAANQTVIELTFFSTLIGVYPEALPNPQNEIMAMLGTANAALAEQFADKMDLSNAVNRAAAKATTKNFLQATSAALEGISKTLLDVTRGFRSIQQEINYGIDVLIGTPILLAEQVSNMITMPARALAGIESRLAGYKALADQIFSSPAGNPAEALVSGSSLPVRRERISNDFHISDLFAVNTLAGSILSAAATPIDASGTAGTVARTSPIAPSSGTGTPTFSTKPQALLTARDITAQYEALVAWRDQGFAGLGQIDDVAGYQFDGGASIQALQDAVALTVGYLVQSSFTLIPERRIVLDRARTIVDLAAELYGSVDDRLDFLIQTNDLTGSEILELPAGKAVVYYRAS
jgi:hypothetical protein